MTIEEKFVYALKLLQTGTVTGIIAIPLVCRSYGGSSNNPFYYQDELSYAYGISGLIALGASLTLILIPKAYGVRVRGWCGGVLTVPFLMTLLFDTPVRWIIPFYGQ